MNKAKCLQCGAILESKHTYDFVKCNCPNGAYTDGGAEYQRIGAKDLSLLEFFNNKKGEWEPALNLLRRK